VGDRLASQRKVDHYGKTSTAVRDDMKFLNEEDKTWILSKTERRFCHSLGCTVSTRRLDGCALQGSALIQ
jgi:hypothetical protein